MNENMIDDALKKMIDKHSRRIQTLVDKLNDEEITDNDKMLILELMQSELEIALEKVK